MRLTVIILAVLFLIGGWARACDAWSSNPISAPQQTVQELQILIGLVVAGFASVILVLAAIWEDAVEKIVEAIEDRFNEDSDDK